MYVIPKAPAKVGARSHLNIPVLFVCCRLHRQNFFFFCRGRKRFVSEGDGGRVKDDAYF